MTKERLKQYLRNHYIEDQILIDFIDRELYDTAKAEIDRVIHSFNLKIYALENLPNLITQVQIEKDKKDKI